MDGIRSMNQQDATRRTAAFATHDLHDISGASGMSMQKAQTLCNRRSDDCHIDLVEHGYFVSVLNDKLPPFDDPKMREVARYAFDVYKSIALPFQGLVGGPGRWMHMFYPEASLTPEELYALSPWVDPSQRTPVDIWKQKAMDRLTELGFPNGLDLEYPYYVNTSTPLLRDMDSVMLIDITAAGFRVDSASTTGANEPLRAGQFSIVRSACGSALADPTGGVALAGLSWSSIVGRRPFAWGGVETADAMYKDANKLIDTTQRGEALKDMERFYADPTLAVVPMGWTLQAWTTPDCLKDTVIGPGLFGSNEFVRTWFSDEGQCKKNLQDDLQAIEPEVLDVVSSVMWNWQ
jgi:ABC-type transport system substrate-binding protein